MVPAIFPTTNGLNVTPIPQLVPGCSVEQVLVSPKLDVMPIPETVRAAAPVFDSVTVLDGLVLPTFCFAKLRLPGFRDPIATGVAVAVAVGVEIAIAFVFS